MNITRYFSPVRIWYLLKRDAMRRWKDYLITIGAFCGFYLLAMVIGAKTEGLDRSLHYGCFASLLYVYGAIFTSMAFREAHRKLGIHDWLMMPASTLEKFTSKLLITSVVFAVLTLLLYSLFSLIGQLVVGVFLGEYYPAFSLFDEVIWKMIGYYLLTQSVFLLGAAWFRKNNLIKTVISLVLFSIIMSVIVSLVAWLVFNDYFWILVRGDFNYSINLSSAFDMSRLAVLGDGVYIFFKISFYGLMAPLCWFGSWLKLKELEVRDGV